MLRGIALGLLLVLGSGAARAADAVDAALEQAKTRRQPLLVDFSAPWCYSCYYMATHVHTGERWQALKRRVQVVELDADSPEGAARMQQWKLRALPSYVLLDAQGRELGRVLGEQKAEDFHARIEALLATAGDDPVEAQALAGGKAGQRAAQLALQAYAARSDAAAGIAWFYDLRGPVRRSYEADAGIRRELDRLRLMEAAERRDGEACAAVAATLMPQDLGCERPYEISRLLRCTADGLLEAPAREALLREQVPSMQALVGERVLGAGPSCADERSAVLGLAELHAALGQSSERRTLLEQAVAHQRRRIGERLAQDRNRADNLRVYLEALEEWAALDALMPQLVAAWPDDYVYAFRHGRSLLQRDRPSEALPYLERAARHAYGQNRLRVAEQQVKALKRLGRGEEAQRVADEVLEANGPWFPEDAARLRAQR